MQKRKLLSPPKNRKRVCQKSKQPELVVPAEEQVRKAQTSRTSIASRPATPSENATEAAEARVQNDRLLLRNSGFVELPPDNVEFKKHSVAIAGPVLTRQDANTFRDASSDVKIQQSLLTHLLSVRSKNISIQPRYASWLVGNRACQLRGHHLLEAAFRCNSVNSVIFGKKSSESSSLQITRLDVLPLADAQAAQQISCLFTLAASKRHMQKRSVSLGAGNALSSDMMFESAKLKDDDVFPFFSSTALLPQTLPLKLTEVSLASVARDLARSELERKAVSEIIGTAHTLNLQKLCKQVTCVSSGDSLWAAVGLISVCALTSSGRKLLSATKMTEFDFTLCAILEKYGRSEIQRRETFEAKERKKKGGASSHEPLTDFDAFLREEEAEQAKTLSSKKRRDASSIDPTSAARWWVNAAMTKHACVLKMLLAMNLRVAENAAIANLEYQSRDLPRVAQNPILREHSIANARDCAKAIAENLVCRQATDVPKIQENTDGTISILRTPVDLKKGAIFACRRAPEVFQPVHTTFCWSLSNIDARTPGVFDELVRSLKIRQENSSLPASSRADRIESEAFSKTDGPKTPASSSLTRTFISYVVDYQMSESQKKSAELFAAGNPAATTEPFFQHSHALALCVKVNDILTRWIAGKSRKTDHSKLLLGITSSGDKAVPLPDLNSSFPLALLVTTDLQAEQNLDSDDKFTVTESVCVDGGVRLFEAIEEIAEDFSRDCVLQARAMLWVGISQASLIADLSSTLSCGSMNTSIACSRRLTVADNTLWLGLSPFDCVVGGILNVQPSFQKSPYAGCYGPGLDSGVTPAGIEARNFKNDGRQHGSLSLSQDLADQLANFFASKHFAIDKNSGKTYAATPVAARGIPHCMVPGIHSALDDYVDGLEKLRTVTGRTNAPTIDTILCKAYSPFSQSLSPVVEEFSDSAQANGIRSSHIPRGNAYQASSTKDEDALLLEPLFRRPSVSSVSDNPFVSSYEYASSFFNFANGIVFIARLLLPSADDPFPNLLKKIKRWVLSDLDSPGFRVCYVADALLLLNTMFPSSHEISKNILLSAFASGIPALHRHVRNQETTCCPPLSFFVQDEDLNQARSFVESLIKAWPALSALLLALHKNDGKHVFRESRPEFRRLFEEAVQSSFYFQIDESGEVPYGNPAYGAKSPADVRRCALDPVIVGVEDENEEARGGLIGVKPFQARQIATLALGAAIEGVEIQAARNEGGLALRVSSAADVLDASGQERTAKSISPLQMDNDVRQFGTREEKKVTCKLQRLAWDKNILLLAPVFAEVSIPRPKAWRKRSVFGAHWEEVARSLAAKRDFKTSEDETIARANILKAADFDGKRRFAGLLENGIDGE